MNQATTTEVSEHPAIRCLFELHYDGTVSVISKSGCSNLDVFEVLRLLLIADWAFEPAEGEMLLNRPGEDTDDTDSPEPDQEVRCSERK